MYNLTIRTWISETVPSLLIYLYTCQHNKPRSVRLKKTNYTYFILVFCVSYSYCASTLLHILKFIMFWICAGIVCLRTVVLVMCGCLSLRLCGKVGGDAQRCHYMHMQWNILSYQFGYELQGLQGYHGAMISIGLSGIIKL